MLKIGKKLIPLVLTGTIILVGGCSKEKKNSDIKEINPSSNIVGKIEDTTDEDNDIVIEGSITDVGDDEIIEETEDISDKAEGMITRGDYVQTTTDVNLRFGNGSNYSVLDTISENTTLYRILSNDDWDLVRYNNYIGYIANDYISKTDDEEKLEVEHKEEHDIICTTANINYRITPNTDEEAIDVIKENTYLEAFAKTSNNWYLVKYNGTYGYVSGEYVTSLTDSLKELYPDSYIDDVITLACITEDNANIYDDEDNIITSASNYDLVRILSTDNDKSLVLIDDTLGYIDNDKLQVLEGIFVTVNLGEQNLVLYNNSDPLINTSITSGKDSTPTRIGLFQIKSKTNGCYLTGADYRTWVDYWMPFDGGIGLHDASWRSSFGGSIYHTSGSHGCVNIPHDVAGNIYNKVEVGTKVLVYNKE